MAHVKITDLPTGLLDASDDLLLMVDVSEGTTGTRKITRDSARTKINYLTDTQSTALKGGSDTTLHYHASDRDLGTHTGSLADPTFANSATIEGTNPALNVEDTALSSVNNRVRGTGGILSLESDVTAAGSASQVRVDVDGGEVGSFNSSATSSVVPFPHITIGTGASKRYIIVGSGDPNTTIPPNTPPGNFTATGSLYMRTDGTLSTTVLYKLSYNPPGTIAWVAI